VLKAKRLKGRYLLFEISHAVLVVDARSVGVPNEILPAEGKAQTLPSLLFPTREWAEKFLLEGGATPDELDRTRDSLRKTNVALLHLGLIESK
jgi:hypothetical protein